MKNNMDYFKTMNEKDLDLTKTAVDWTDKAFRGNGDCAAIARTTGKTCKVVLRDGEDTSFLESMLVFILYCVLSYWAVGQTIYANKIQIGSLKDIFLTRFVLGVLLGLILIPVAILKKLFIH